MNLRDRIIDMLSSRGVFDVGLADDIEALVLLESGRAKPAETPAVDYLAGIRRTLNHQAGLLRVVTPETAADPAFRARVAGTLTEIGGKIA